MRSRTGLPFGANERAMGLPNLLEFVHAPCRFRLRSGREVFGVVWKSEPKDNRLWFSSIGDYERTRMHPGGPIGAISMLPEEILLAERLAV